MKLKVELEVFKRNRESLYASAGDLSSMQYYNQGSDRNSIHKQGTDLDLQENARS